MRLYQNESNTPKYNAQRNLQGRTHYVDDDTLKFHKSRIISSRESCNGLVFWIVESCALDMRNTRRGFRYVIFDVFGNVIARPALEDSYRTSDMARKRMYEALNALDVYALTGEAISRRAENYRREIADANKKLAEMESQYKAA